MPSDSISIIVPAYNEAEHLEATIAEVSAAVKDEFDAWELLVFDDCSSDGTDAVADRCAARDKHVQVIHNSTNRGMGWNFRTGVRMAHMQYLTIVNGKHDITAAELRKIFRARHEADIVIPYHTNQCERTWFRRHVSDTFTALLNLLFGYRLHYYNDSVLHQAAVVQALRLRTNSYAFQAETLIKALRCGLSYVEVPTTNIYPPGIKTSAFRLKNVLGVAMFFLWLLYDVHLIGVRANGCLRRPSHV